jgi:uncharacterized protein YndB with AHSA1/START domain/predicted enzyme related to lactoylglutathione lyase
MSNRTKPSLTLKRQLRASPEKVFEAWTRPEALKAWFGPHEIAEVPVAEVDLKVGGRFRVVMRAADGEEHRVGGVYRQIEPPRRLQFTWAWESTPERESLVTIRLKPKDGGTLLTLTHEQFFDETARDRHQSGWTGCLDKLVRLFDGQAQEANMAKTATASKTEAPAQAPMSWSHGKFHWNELVTHDLERAKKFYAGTLGWRFEAMPMGGGTTYWLVKVGDQAVGGMFDARGQGCNDVPEGWLPYIAVDDVDARVAKAVKAGAKVMKAAHDIPGVGRIVMLREPGGAGICWITPAAGEGCA